MPGQLPSLVRRQVALHRRTSVRELPGRKASRQIARVTSGYEAVSIKEQPERILRAKDGMGRDCDLG